jgi:hypothetical protein
VTKTEVIDLPGISASADEPRLLGVHLTIRNLSSAPYRDPAFDSCSYLVKSVKPTVPTTSGTTWGWGPIQGTGMPAHTLRSSVTIMPGRVLGGWVWFEIQGRKPAAGAADFRVAHVFSFQPAGGSASVIGTWQLRP